MTASPNSLTFLLGLVVVAVLWTAGSIILTSARAWRTASRARRDARAIIVSGDRS